MNILDKLKNVDVSLIGHAGLAKAVEEALDNLENKDSLLEREIENYEKVYSLVEENFPAAAGIAPAIPPVNEEDLLSKLQKNKIK